MSAGGAAPRERWVSACAGRCRVWESGPTGGEAGPEGDSELPLLYLGGVFGVPHWTPFLEQLAERRRVVVPSLPGFPGGDAPAEWDALLDALVALLDVLDAAGVAHADCVGASLGGALAAELAALASERVRRLVLIAPLGLHDAADPVADPWARLASEPSPWVLDPARYAALTAAPGGVAPDEWALVLARAQATAASLLWPNCELGTARRLHRVRTPALILWGECDALIPPSYAARWAAGMSGSVDRAGIASAGHLADLDAPEDCARRVRAFLPFG